ncbi:MAG: hypothetical protein H7321_01535 [Bacteroidia bacterium]|nr:hypothetical protein [Bacteroidia bacterium]
MKFSTIPGHEILKRQLTESAATGRVAHAQLFLGREGCGNLALALAYAQYLACTDRAETDSCGVCPSCNKYQQLVHPDLHFSFPVAGEGNVTSFDFMEKWRIAISENPYMNIQDWMNTINGDNKLPNINVRDISSIIRRLAMKAFESEYKVMIIWMPEYLGKFGNALLKIIEEPQANTIIILVAQNADNILSTILSRSQLIKVQDFKNKEIQDYLINETNTEPALAQNIANISSGNLNKALKLNVEMESAQYPKFREWLLDCYQGNVIKINMFSDGFIEQGREKLKSFLSYGLLIVRATIIEPYITNEGKLSTEESELVKNLTKLISHRNAENVYRAINGCIYEIERNGNPKLIFINLSLELRKYLKSAA